MVLKLLNSKKKLNLIFIIIMVMSINCQSQETFFNTLKQLNVCDEDIEVSYNFKNSIINQDSSFFNKKTGQSRCDLKYILLTKNDRFSIFGIFGADEFKTTWDNLFIQYSHIVIFDKLINKNFIIEYGFDGYCAIINIKKKTLTLCRTAFEQNVSSITEVDSNLIPKWSLRLDYLPEENGSNENPLHSVKKYILIDDIWYEKNKLFNNNKLPFKTLSYQELLYFENEYFDESIPIKHTDDALPAVYQMEQNE